MMDQFEHVIGFEVGGSPTEPRVHVTGEVDLATAPLLRQTLADLADGGARLITLEFGGVTFLDSSGLGVMVAAMKRLELQGGRIRVDHPRDNVRRVFEITGLDQAFGM
jgi:anti-sigma B factor antagonist